MKKAIFVYHAVDRTTQRFLDGSINRKGLTHQKHHKFLSNSTRARGRALINFYINAITFKQSSSASSCNYRTDLSVLTVFKKFRSSCERESHKSFIGCIKKNKWIFLVNFFSHIPSLGLSLSLSISISIKISIV